MAEPIYNAKLPFWIEKVDYNRKDVHTAIPLMHKQVFKGNDVYPLGDAEWWIVWDGNLKSIGFAGLRLSPLEGIGYLCRAGVLPCARGHGLQKRLIRVRERYAREHDLSALVTDTIFNPVSSNHLIDCGYRLFSPACPWGNDGSLYFRKDL